MRTFRSARNLVTLQAQELERELDALKQEAAEKCRDMTIEEKRELGANLGKLPSEKLQRVVDIIIADSPVEEEVRFGRPGNRFSNRGIASNAGAFSGYNETDCEHLVTRQMNRSPSESRSKDWIFYRMLVRILSSDLTGRIGSKSAVSLLPRGMFAGRGGRGGGPRRAAPQHALEALPLRQQVTPATVLP